MRNEYKDNKRKILQSLREKIATLKGNKKRGKNAREIQ
jgi:hypothetical protein